MANIVLDNAYVSSPCRLRSMDNSAITSGRIIEINEKNVVVRMVPELRHVIPYNQNVKLSILNGKLGNRTLIATVFASTTRLVKLFDLKEVDEFEKREYFRINVSLKGKVMPYNPNYLSSIDYDEAQKDIDGQVVDIKNISLSGILFSGPINMDTGEKLLIEIQTPMGNLTLGAIIRRKQKLEDGGEGYGCEFEPYPDKVEDALWKYMMQKELENIRKARGEWLPHES